MLPLLEGRVLDPESFALHDRVSHLEHELEMTKEALSAEKQKNSQLQNSVRKLRDWLQPQYAALKQLFGEIGEAASDETTGVTDPKRKVWKSWIDKFGPDTLNSRFIGALLDHGSMTQPQLRVAMKCGNQSVYDTAGRLSKLGLLSKNGGKYSLKEL